MPFARQCLHFFIAACSALLAYGCSDSSKPGEPNSATNPSTQSTEVPQRVVVVGPSTAETVFALGVGAKVVGVSDFCRDPNAKDLPRVGGQFDPNLERITALKPDAILTQGENPSLQSLSEKLNIRYLAFHTDSVASWIEEVHVLGKVFQVEDRAHQLADAFQESFRQQGIPEHTSQPLVALLISRNGANDMIAVGSGSFLHELLIAAGGRNAFATNPKAYFNLSQEALLHAAPEILLDLTIPTSTDPQQIAPLSNQAVHKDFADAFPTLPAVIHHKVFALNEDYLFLPGPRMMETIAEFRRCLGSE